MQRARSGIVLVGIVLLLPTLVTGCEDRTVTAVDVAAIAVSPPEGALSPGQTLQLTATVLDARGDPLDGRTVAWSSDDVSVATVDADGMVEAVAAGSTRIRASIGGVEGQAALDVDEGARIGLSPSELELHAEVGADAAPRELLVTSEGGGRIGDLELAITYQDGDGWLEAELRETETPATVRLRASARNLGQGTWVAELRIASSTAQSPPRTARIVFRVGSAPPAVRLSTTAAGFSWESGREAPPAQTIRVTNAGGGELDGLRVSVRYGGGAEGWLEASLSRSSAPADLVLRVRPDGLASGTYDATATVRSAGGASADVRVRLGVGELVGELRLEPGTLSFSATEGKAAPEPSSVRITNLGTGELTGLSADVSYGSGAGGWLEASLSHGSTPADLGLRIDHSGLDPGEYTAAVAVRAPDAVNSPEHVAVTLDVRPAARPSVAVSRVRYRTAGNGQHLDVTTFLEDEAGAPVAGASVQVEVRNHDRNRTWSNTGTTGDDGAATFRIQHHPEGCYETTVRGISASGREWDGATPVNEHCRGTDSASENGQCDLSDAAIDDDFHVSDGVHCTLTGVTIVGNLSLGAGAVLHGEDLEVHGNVEAGAAAELVLHESFVSGNVRVEGGGDAGLLRNRIEGNVELEANHGALFATENGIDGDLKAFHNRDGPFTFSHNTIGGNLQCEGNEPPPSGTGNEVGGNREGQCSGL